MKASLKMAKGIPNVKRSNLFYDLLIFTLIDDLIGKLF